VAVVENDAIGVRTRATSRSATNHRLIDGAVADEFMSHLKKTLENFDPNAYSRGSTFARWPTMSRKLTVRCLGVVGYAEGLEIQKDLVTQRAAAGLTTPCCCSSILTC